MTNADYIRRMDDATLTEFLLQMEAGDIDYSQTFCDLCPHETPCDGCLKKWLSTDALEANGLDNWYEDHRGVIYNG